MIEKLRNLRKSKNLTLLEVSKRIGCSSNSISLYELGLRVPSLSTLKKLAELYEVNVEYIINLFLEV